MGSTVQSRPNHYETLGLKPTATAEEIRQAFARELRRPRPFGGLAQLGVAFETLRDPAKRKAYDRSIGLAPEQAAVKWSVAAPRWSGVTPSAGFPLAAARPPAFDNLPAPVRSAEPEPRPEARTAPFIAAALRELADPEPLRRPAPDATPAPVAAPAPQPEPVRAAAPPAEPVLPEAEHGVIDWKRVGIAGGGLVAAVGLIGAWAGWEASNDIPQPPAQEQNATTLALPPAEPPAVLAQKVAPVQEAQVAEARPQPLAQRAAVASEPAERALPRPVELTAAEEQQLAGNAFVASATEQAATAAVAAEEATAEPQSAAPVAASLPLPNRVVARTIHRIGYACGQVASTSPIEGAAPGTFKVTCTSGHSYRAQPVRGRYHFRRMGSR